ncbi:MAG TPA: ECF-type sigma factor [Thermoanaerobaculia bacterium]|nr:ECF-type sigma factor [Thermoanaerobaculia bacterium]
MIDPERGSPGLDSLMPEIYDELRRLAKRAMSREGSGSTLQTTALVHEAYLRLASIKDLEVGSRPQFFSLAARMMRRILVDHARARRSAKRGGGAQRVTLSEEIAGESSNFDVLALDQALERLAAKDEKLVRIVELRFIAGLSVEETAKIVEVSPTTIKRESAMARAWLFRELTDGGARAV